MVGLVSWGEGCAREDYAGVNARISAVTDWIDQQICELSTFRPSTCPSRTPPVSNAQSPPASTPGGSAGAPQQPGGASGVPSPLGASPAGGRDSTDIDDVQTPMRPGGGSAGVDVSRTFPGKGPVKATNAVTVNLLYRANVQRLTWSLDQEDPTTDNWNTLYQSPRGRSYQLDSRTFDQLTPGWYRFRVVDPSATQGMNPNNYALQWMSLMGPRGTEVWGMDTDFTKSDYNIYFEISGTNGIPSLGNRPDVMVP